MKKNAFITYASVPLMFSAGALTQAQAGGFALEQQNAAAMGAAYAGAQAEQGDAGYAVYNPAAIANGPRLQFSLNAAGIFPSSSYDNASATLLGVAAAPGLSADDGAVKTAFVPNLSAAWGLNDAVTLGLSVNAPFGLHTEYDEMSVIRYQALTTDIKTIAISPMAAIRLTDSLSFGGALRIQYLDFEASNALDAAGVFSTLSMLAPPPGTDDASVSLTATDWAVGFQLGLQADLGPNTRAGISYTSKIEHEFSGDAAFDIAGSVSAQALNANAGLFAPSRFSSALATPASIAAGLAHDVSDRFTLKASAVYTLWNSFEGVVAAFDNPAQPVEVLTQDWKDSWAVSLGGDFKASEATTLRAGVMFDQSPVNEPFASPRIPDADRFWINAGVSHEVSDNFAVDLGAGYVFLDDLDIAQSPAAPENLFRGGLTADFDTTAFVASLRFTFKR